MALNEGRSPDAAKNHHPRCICEDPHEPGLTTCPCIADIYGGGECEHAAKRRLEKLLTEKSSAATRSPSDCVMSERRSSDAAKRQEIEAMEAEARKLGQSLGYSDDEIEAKLREVREARQRAAARAQGEVNVR